MHKLAGMQHVPEKIPVASVSTTTGSTYLDGDGDLYTGRFLIPCLSDKPYVCLVATSPYDSVFTTCVLVEESDDMVTSTRKWLAAHKIKTSDATSLLDMLILVVLKRCVYVGTNASRARILLDLTSKMSADELGLPKCDTSRYLFTTGSSYACNRISRVPRDDSITPVCIGKKKTVARAMADWIVRNTSSYISRAGADGTVEPRYLMYDVYAHAYTIFIDMQITRRSPDTSIFRYCASPLCDVVVSNIWLIEILANTNWVRPDPTKTTPGIEFITQDDTPARSPRKRVRRK